MCINNKGCAQNHLSCWSYVLVYVGRSSCQRLTNDRIRKRKQVWSCNCPKKQNIQSTSCEGSFLFDQSSKRLSADRLRCEHRRFCMVTSVGLVSYIFADQGPRGELLTKQSSFLMQPYARLARTALQIFTSQFSPATISLASIHETHVSARQWASLKRCASEPTQDKLNQDKMAGMIAAGAQGVSNSRL